MNGPYETELEAVKAARIWETQGQTMLSASLTMLIEASSAAGVTRGAYDTLTLEWLAGRAGVRGREGGRLSLPAGAATLG